MIDNNSDDSKDRRLMANDYSISFGRNDLPAPLKEAVKTLYCSFDELRTYLHIQRSNASMFAILQQYPCPVRCVDELKKSYNNDEVDQLYNAKEEYAKRILIDEIYSRFGSSVKLKEKYKISSGTLDLAIMLEHQGKIIGIEIKNGSSEQTYVKMLHEIERYLIHTYLLLVIRIPYKIVHPFVRDVYSLIQRIEWITKKANLLTSGQQSGHECQWCVDSQCPSSTANIDTSFYTDTIEVVKKTIDILEKEIRIQNVVEKGNEIFGQQRDTEITKDSIGYEYNGNGDAREKIFKVGIPDNGNGNGRDERGSKKRIKDLKPGMRRVSIIGNIESITEARTVNLRSGGTAQVADAIISDETGSIKLSLWDDQIHVVKQGDKVSIENGYTKAFRGENSLNTGKLTKL